MDIPAYRLLFKAFLLYQFCTGISGWKVSFNFDAGTIVVHTNYSQGTYTFHESDDNLIPAPRYTITAEDISTAAAGFDQLTADNLQGGQLDDEELIFLDVILNNTDSGRTMNLMDFAAVLPSHESNFKFLPFKMVDLQSILRMTRLPSMYLDRDHPHLGIHINRTSHKQLVHSFKTKNATNFKAKDLDPEHQNLLITILFFLISFNAELDTDERYEICVANKVRSDVPFALERYVHRTVILFCSWQKATSRYHIEINIFN